jgi:hypothetical protein
LSRVYEKRAVKIQKNNVKLNGHEKIY